MNAEVPSSEPDEVEPTEASAASAGTVCSAQAAPAASSEAPVSEPAASEAPAAEPADASAPPPLVEPAEPVTATTLGDPVEVPQPVVVEAVVVEPVAVTVAEPVEATPDPGLARTGLPAVAPDSRVVYVDSPQPPRKRGNRPLGILIALGGAVVFAVFYAIILVIIELVENDPVSFDFVTTSEFWIPVAFFAVGFILLVLIANRASWWAYIFGSIFVAVFVYFGSVVVLELMHGITTLTPRQAANEFGANLVSSGAIVALLLAREVSLWVGIAVAARGRRVKARNVEARQNWETEQAARKVDQDSAWAPSA